MAYDYFDFKGPSLRPGMIQSVTWVGPNNNLRLEVGVYDAAGNLKTVTFKTTNASGVGDICLPNTADVTNIRDEIMVAHLRMMTLIADVPIGSTEWSAAVGEGSSANFQTGIGTVKINALRMTSQIDCEIDLRKNGTSSPTKTLVATKDQFPIRADYLVDPETQCNCIPGAIEKQFSTYVHNDPTTELTQNQKDDIAAYVLGLSLWV